MARRDKGDKDKRSALRKALDYQSEKASRGEGQGFCLLWAVGLISLPLALGFSALRLIGHLLG